MPIEAPPPSRYEIIERDRRLIVIDTWTGADQAAAYQFPASAPLVVEKTSFDGRSSLTTSALYDDNGPRTIAIGPDSVAMITGLKIALGLALAMLVGLAFAEPWLLVAPAILFAQPRLRAKARGWTTAWLDRASIE